MVTETPNCALHVERLTSYKMEASLIRMIRSIARPTMQIFVILAIRDIRKFACSDQMLSRGYLHDAFGISMDILM
jgi:hypothetical protein